MGVKPLGAKKLEPTRHLKLEIEPLLSDPVVGSDSIFVGDCHQVLKLDRQSLQTVWRVQAEDFVPAFVQDSVLILGGGGEWRGITVADGSPLWGPTPLGRCLLWRGNVLGLKPLAVIDAMSGAVVRTLCTQEDLIADTSVCGDVVVGGSSTNQTGDPIVAFHLAEERSTWRRDLMAEAAIRVPSRETARVMCAGDRVLILGRRDCLFGCSLEDGSIRWAREITMPYHLPNVSDGRVYALAVSRTERARLVCMNLENGGLLYEVPQPLIDTSDRPRRGTVHSGHIVFATEKGRVLGLKLEDGAVAWWSEYHETLTAAVFVDGLALVPAFDGTMLVFEPPTL